MKNHYKINRGNTGDWKSTVLKRSVAIAGKIQLKSRKLLLFLFVLTGVALSAQGPLCLNVSTLVPSVGTNPNNIVTADFNVDGFADVACVNVSNNNVSVLLGTGTGSFGVATSYTVGSNPGGLISGDFNNDGRTDLAITRTDGNCVILQNSGVGTFATANIFTVVPSGAASEIATADFNADGNLDLAVTSNLSAQVFVWFGAGNSTFGSAAIYATLSSPRGICVGDFNGDSQKDIAITHIGGLNGVSVLRNVGAGTFTTPVAYGVGGDPLQIVSGDFNMDGHPDLAVPNFTSNTISVLLGSTSGTFATQTTYTTGAGPHGIVAADFNGDGISDLATVNAASNNASFFIASLSGVFANGISTATLGTTPYRICAADLTSDGKLDAVVTNDATFNLSIILNAIPTLTTSASSTAICTGQSATITAGTVNSYNWSTGAATNSIVVSPTSFTTYVVSGTVTATGCTNSAVRSISVNSLPTLTISPATVTLCSGSSTTLTASGASTYTWTSGPVNASFAVTPSVTTAYGVTGTSSAGCTNTAALTVSVSATPTIGVNTTSATICVGQSATLTGTGASTYTWSGGPSTDTYVVSPTVTTVYTVAGTSTAGCTSTGFQTVTVNSLPSLTISTSTTSICQGQSVSMTASGANSYQWTGGPATAGYNPSPTTNTTYFVVGTSVAGCTNTTSQAVTVNTVPVVAINTTSATICNGQTSSLTATGASTYTWASGPSTAGYTVNPSSNTTYTVTGTSAAGCTNTATQLVTVNALPSLSVSMTSTVICVGQTTTLTASGATSYTWTSGPISASYSVSPASNTTYTVNGTSAAGCTNSVAASVSVNALPNVTINTSTNTICVGQTASLTGNGAVSYAWVSGPGTATYNVSPATATTYTVIGTAATSCTNSATQAIAVNALPSVVVTVTNPVICVGQTATMVATGANSYAWTSGPAVALYTVSPGSNATYTVTGASAVGCTNTATQLITVNALPTVTIATTPTVICAGKTSTMTAGGASTYVWTSGPSTASYAVSPVTNTNYTVTGTSAAGCTNTAVASVSVNAIPAVTITAPGTVICVGQTASMTASGANTYVWSNGPVTAGNNVSPASNTNYTVTGTTSASGCTNIAVQSISVNALPNVSVTTTGSIICAGKSTTMTAGGAASYTWTAGPINAIYSVSPVSNTTYTVTGTAATGCTNIAMQSVSVNALPNVTISTTPTVICVGQTSSLQAGGATSYVWTSGPSSANYNVTPVVNTNYTVTGTAAATGCSNTAMTSVSVNVLPIVSISPSSTVICAGESATLTASGATTYVWNTSATTNTLLVTPPSNTNYTVIGTDAATGCTNIAVRAMSVNALPSVSISPSSTVICAGKTATLTGMNASTYTWSGGPQTAIYTVNPVSITVYTLTGTNATSGCSNTAMFSMSVNALPILTITPTSSVICFGKTTTMTASGANTYTWTSGPVNASFAVSPTTLTNYTVTATSAASAGTCSNTAVQQISVNLLPILSTTATPTVICSGQISNLNASGAGTYTWINGTNASTYLVSPTITTNYTVIGADAVNGCTNTAQRQVSVNAQPNMSITSTGSILCSGKSATLTATGANTYSWTGGPSTAGNTVTPMTTTLCIVEGTTTATGCTNLAVYAITVNPSPTLSIVPSSTAICSGTSATLVASGANSYTWTAGPVNNATYVVSPPLTANYTVTGTNATNNCTANLVQNLVVNATPTLAIAATSTVICFGKVATYTVTGASTYSWNTGSTANIYTISPASNFTYNVLGTSAAGCTATAVKAMSVNALPNPTIAASSTVLCAGKSLTMVASGASTYTWVGGPSSATYVLSPTVTADYTVVGTDAVTNCSNTAIYNMSVNPIPMLTVTPSTTLNCSGSSVTLTATGGDTYSWRNGPTTDTYVVSPASSAIYTVTGMFSASSCTNQLIYTLTITALPVMTITPTSTIICPSKTVTLNVTGAGSYTWTNGPATSSYVVNPTVTTVYTVTGVAPVSGCSNTAQRTVSVYPAPNVVVTPSNPAVCFSKSGTLTASGASTYSWLGVGGSAVAVISPTIPTTYSVIGTSAASCTNMATVLVNINPLPPVTITGVNLVCPNTPVVLTGNGANTYTWVPSGNGSTIVVTPSVSTVYSVTGTSTLNCSASASFQLLTVGVVTPSLCLVTVDSLSINNEIYWDRSAYPQADTFYVYRETSGNIYSLIARVPKTSPAMVIDNNRFGLYTGDPNYSAYKYKLQYRDSCGNLSPMGPYHKSVFVQDNQNGNFNWNFYEIEGQGPIMTVNYYLVRRNILSGATATIGGSSSGFFTDPMYSTVAATGNQKWFVEMSNFYCDPNARPAAAGKKTTTKSNNTNEKQFPTPVGLNKFAEGEKIHRVYPNPAVDYLMIQSPDITETVEVELYDVSGRLVLSEQIKGENHKIETSALQNGVYFVKFGDSKGQKPVKIIVQHP